MEIKLLPLICPKCGRDILACEGDNLYFCSGCGNSFEIVEGEWKSIDTLYTKPNVQSSSVPIYLPFWYLKTKVKLEQSISMKDIEIVDMVSRIPEFTAKLKQLLEPENSEISMDFFVPAFGTTNRYLLMDDIGLLYTASPPEIQEDTPKEMVGGKYTPKDALKLCNGILFSIERNSSRLLGSNFEIDVFAYKIVGVPFFEEGPYLVDGLLGKKIFSDAVENFQEIKKLYQSLN